MGAEDDRYRPLVTLREFGAKPDPTARHDETSHTDPTTPAPPGKARSTKRPKRSRKREHEGDTTSVDIVNDVPILDIEVTHEHGPVPRQDRPRRVFEVWTQNRIYHVDAVFRCVAVTERATGKDNDSHPFVGMHLVGGQTQHGEVLEISQPLPRPGTDAVFEATDREGQGRFSHTSQVCRVVLRYSVISIAPTGERAPTWNEITGVAGRD